MRSTSRSALAALLPGLALGLVAACDANEAGSATATQSSTAASSTPATEAGQGLLESLDPQDPSRPRFHDFGELIHGDQLTWNARFRNSGAGPLKILAAQAACGCTRLATMTITGPGDLPPRVIKGFRNASDVLATVPPGAELVVAIEILTAFTAANQRKLALFRLTTDSDLEPYITLELGFLPTRPFMFAPTEARLLNTPTSHGGNARVKVIVDRKETRARILSIESAPEGLSTDLVTESFGGEFVWYVDVSVAPLTPLGVIRGDVVLRTTDREGEGEGGRLTIPAIAQVVPDVVLGKPLITLGAVPSSAGATFESELTALVPGARLKVLATRVESSVPMDLGIQTAPINPDSSGRASVWTVQIAMPPGTAPGFISGDVVFVLDEPVGGASPDGPSTELRVRLSGQVVEG
ncbi:MAG: DUF1573 domain-containing protein [Planctomycetota bacterium]|nr:DUF1573 domain-containing protein [Planctomycetota bacterium]